MLPYIIWITKRGIKGLNIGARFRDCKPGEKGLQIGEFQLGTREKLQLQIGAREIINQGRDYKLMQNN